MGEPDPTRTEYAQAIRERDQAIAERDQAIAERDYALKFVQDLGAAFRQERRLAFKATDDGVEVRALYPSQADAEAVATHIRDLRAMVSRAGVQAAQALH